MEHKLRIELARRGSRNLHGQISFWLHLEKPAYIHVLTDKTRKYENP